MSDRIGEQILVESYKVLYDYIAMNESEDAKFELQIKTYQKIIKTIAEEAKSKSDLFRKLKNSSKKIEDPIAVIVSMEHLYDYYKEDENDALELMKNISSNDVYSVKPHALDGGVRIVAIPSDIDDVGYKISRSNYDVIDTSKLKDDKYKKFILKAFPVWVKCARRLFALANNLNKED